MLVSWSKHYLYYLHQCCLFFAKDTTIIDTTIAGLKCEFDLEPETDVSTFLSINIHYEIQANQVKLTQPNLIE